MTSHRGRVAAVLVVLLLALLVAVGVMLTRGDDAVSSATSPSLAADIPTTTTGSTASKRSDISSRLREIMEVRDRALVTRDPSLLNRIYTVDCKCLEDGRALIRQLREENVVWRGVTTNIAIESTEEVNSRLWIIVATVNTPPVRIEDEAGQLIRTVPAESNLVRFALAKPQNENEWLLGHASSVS